jgi:hypothetical protein
MSDNLLGREVRYASKLLKKYPFLRKMWQEREKVFDGAHRKEVLIKKKYNKIAQKAGLKSVKFAYSEILFWHRYQRC